MKSVDRKITTQEGICDPIPKHKIRVLYFSLMTVSPGSGGGNTIFNLLEPSPIEGEVFYATPTAYQPYCDPFPEISSRLRWFSRGRVLPSIKYWRESRIVRNLNTLLHRVNTRMVRERIVRKVIQYIRQLQIDVLLLCPQHQVDLSAELVVRSGLPTIVWFMDNYYSDQSSISYVRKIWDRSRKRFVISEAMQQYFSEFYGGHCEVLNNSVTFDECYPEPIQSDRLRIAYAGSMHSYYLDSMSMVLKELCGLGDQLTLDIYSYSTLPLDDQFSHDCPVRYLPPIPLGELPRRLQEYDILLLVSSFKPEHRAIAETSLASKVADYLAAGRCILAYGPEYSENVRYAQRHGFGEIVTSQLSGQLREAVLFLARSPERRRELGERAYYFGRERHNKTTNSARLWGALSQACKSSRNSCK